LWLEAALFETQQGQHAAAQAVVFRAEKTLPSPAARGADEPVAGQSSKERRAELLRDEQAVSFGRSFGRRQRQFRSP
jgi:hypothetical protein